VHTSLDADAFFPEFDTSEWNLVFSEKHFKDEKHQYDFTFETYLKK
jgi:dihydrofolate reductase